MKVGKTVGIVCSSLQYEVGKTAGSVLLAPDAEKLGVFYSNL